MQYSEDKWISLVLLFENNVQNITYLSSPISIYKNIHVNKLLLLGKQLQTVYKNL